MALHRRDKAQRTGCMFNIIRLKNQHMISSFSKSLASKITLRVIIGFQALVANTHVAREQARPTRIVMFQMSSIPVFVFFGCDDDDIAFLEAQVIGLSVSMI